MITPFREFDLSGIQFKLGVIQFDLGLIELKMCVKNNAGGTHRFENPK